MADSQLKDKSEATAEQPTNGGGQPKPARRRQVFPRWLSRLGLAALAVLVVLGAAAEYVAHNAEPILRRRVIASLQQRFHSPVELDTLHLSVLHGLRVSGGGLRILRLAGPNVPDAQPQSVAPMLSVKNFEFRSGIRQLFEPTMRVVTIYVQGMQLDIPPKQQRGSLLANGQTGDDPKRRGQPRLGLVIDKIVCSDVTLTIETDKPGKQPLVFAIRSVTLRDVGLKKPFLFDALLVNPKPVGDIHSTGHFGPWQDDNPRDSPIDGNYSFTHADLGTIKGIKGMLWSTGNYSGTLGEIGVAGTTDTPDFALDMSDHPVDLRTEFNATVDGTTGDTRLNSVHATLLHTALQVSGMVIRASSAASGSASKDGSANSKGGSASSNDQYGIPGDSSQNIPGHIIDISVASDQARIEDLLTLGVKTTPPLMQGPMTLRARLNIPPGHVSVTQKMRIQGTFTIRGATFDNPKWQQTVDKLSMRAQGDPEKANAQDAKRVASQMEGIFALANATLTVPKLNYQMPGAQVDLTGKYSLDGKAFDFNGTVRTKATASQMLTGWKSIVAMPLDPLLKKNGAGLEVPITISGTESEPKLGLDLGKLGAQIFSRHKDNGQQGAAQHP